MSTQRVIIGNSLHVLQAMEPESIDVCVTSPPYWDLRDYGSEPTIYGGDPTCSHEWTEHRQAARGGIGKHANLGANKDGKANNRGHPTITEYCTKCGAWRGQLGLEPTPQEYIAHLIAIFDEVHRVLKPTGACWVNLGDTYGRDKSLLQIPARFAIAMSDKGWTLRNEIIWHKPNVMPVSVKDRFTVDHEKFYFFTKEPTYYFKQIREPLQKGSIERSGRAYRSAKLNQDGQVVKGINIDKGGVRMVNPEGRNKRTTWTIPTAGSHEDHCAMFPPALIDIPIKACCPEGGTVLDPFLGSGTTLEYCRTHNINGVGIEINPKYKEIIDRRSQASIPQLEVYE